MRVWIVLFGNTKKPEVCDEVAGYAKTEEEADQYCRHKNRIVEDGCAYYYEEAPRIPEI